MGIKLKRDPFYKSEQLYRVFTAASFYVILAVLISAAIIVPLFGSSTAYWVMLLYSVFFFAFAAVCLVCAIMGFTAFAVSKNENLLVQGILHLIDCVLTLTNIKLFSVIFIYGIRKDNLAEKITGSDTDAFVSSAVRQWIYLIIAFLISCILAILSTVKLSKERKYRQE